MRLATGRKHAAIQCHTTPRAFKLVIEELVSFSIDERRNFLSRKKSLCNVGLFHGKRELQALGLTQRETKINAPPKGVGGIASQITGTVIRLSKKQVITATNAVCREVRVKEIVVDRLHVFTPAHSEAKAVAGSTYICLLKTSPEY